MQTHNGFQWELGKWYETSGKGELCTEGWLHCYRNKDMAVLINPAHADIKNPRLFVGEGKGKVKNDGYLKSGFSEMRLTKEIKLPEWTLTQKIAFAILCALEVCHEEPFARWAKNWLNGKDRTQKSAKKAENSMICWGYREKEICLPKNANYVAGNELWGAVMCLWADLSSEENHFDPCFFKKIIKKAKKVR